VKRRFPIEQDVRYKMLYGQRIAETGSGRTMNIASGGIWFSTQTMLASGMAIELSLTWPVLLKLMIYGCVVRSNDRGAAVAIERHEFRTQGRAQQNQPTIPQRVEYRLHGNRANPGGQNANRESNSMRRLFAVPPPPPITPPPPKPVLTVVGSRNCGEAITP
jgi:hypothetical protein